MMRKIYQQIGICFLFFLCIVPFISSEENTNPVSGEIQKAKSVTISVMGLPTTDVRTVQGKAANAVVRRFMELHPDIKVEGFKGMAIPGMSMELAPLLAMAGGMAPEVLYVNFRISESYISQGFLYPLDEYIEEWKKENPQEVERAINPNIWPVIRRSGIDGEKHTWMVPHGGALAIILMYRKDLYQEAGLDPDKPPKNWDEFYQYCQKLTIPEKGQYGFMLSTGPSTSWNFINFLWSAGGDVIVDDGKDNWKAVFNSQEAVTALEFYWKLVCGKWNRDGKTYTGVARRTPDAGILWKQGKIAMMLTYLDEQTLIASAGINPDIIGMTPVPLGPTGKRGSELNSRLYGINATVKDKNVRDAAWEYIKFINSKEGRRIRTTIYVENGWAKYIPPKYLREFGYEKYLNEVPKGWEQTLEEAIASGKPEPYGKNCELIYYEMSPPVEGICLINDEKIVHTRAKELLDKAVARTNEKLLGILSEQEKKKRAIITPIVLILIVLVFAFVLYKVFSAFHSIYRPKLVSGGEARRPEQRKYIIAYLLMLPALLSVLLWAYYPLIRGSIMAFQEYNIIQPSKWVALKNFEEVLFTARFWKSLLNTIYYVVLFLGLGFLSPILLALLLHEVPKGKILFRTIYYLPAVTTGLVIMFLWSGFYDPSPAGLLNKIIGFFGISPQTWLNNPSLAMLCIIIPIIWAGIGPGCIIYLAALKSIPEELYEAADLDGASIWQKIRIISFSHLKPLVLINFLGAFIGAMRSFDFIFAMTGGGPMDATHVVGLEIWYNAFLYLKFGYAVAMAWLLGSLLIGFTVYNLKILSKLQFRTVK